ncbi:hypothetical protein GCM10010873_05450 [Cypionkella aquatica]|uniref:Transposase n=1 Tax=Cypionkella aquatica TaxID=1756042 RepID=A0AA37TVQ4_9RHOB|nr:hypothetical protein [Cypionkella aquatica]GLS85572.1 hypothetical protein GCM10010873_05450 [Cypionkella aquatica]
MADRQLARLDFDEYAVCARCVGASDLARKDPDCKSLVDQSDRGSQHLSIKYTDLLVEAEIDVFVGTVADAYDNAWAECVIRLFKAEASTRSGPWKLMRKIEWVDWYSNRRLLGPIRYILVRRDLIMRPNLGDLVREA